MTENKPFAIEWAETAPEGATVYCILRHVSKSGMSRVIDLVVFVDGQPRYLRSLADDARWHYKRDRNHDGFKVGGAGMDMGFAIVYDLGSIFHGDGYRFRHQWL